VAIEGYLPLNFVVVFSSMFFRFLTTGKLIGDFLNQRQCAACKLFGELPLFKFLLSAVLLEQLANRQKEGKLEDWK